MYGGRAWAAGLILLVTTPGGVTHALSYDDAGRLTGRTAGAIQQTYGLDALGRALTAAEPNTGVHVTSTYDLLGTERSTAIALGG